ncbi:MAG TPA: rhodanese-like domain-containing protein [Verrucomicrobiales bacterium]|nr:rhodanese-like domain-containing protein [Verrucomicrobiales bacterium]|tara:strand:+ start:4554 stop:4967 length:414 start_codon:yes stop_codon:yes gene_type:complete
MNFFSSLLLVLPLLMNTASVEKPDQKPATVIHLDAGQAAKIISIPDKKKRPTIIDIRTLGEFKAGHLESAIHIDFLKEDFPDAIRKLPRDKPYLVHCQSGGRSSNSLKLWKTLGFTEIYHLDGGFLAWKKAGLPVAK